MTRTTAVSMADGMAASFGGRLIRPGEDGYDRRAGFTTA